MFGDFGHCSSTVGGAMKRVGKAGEEKWKQKRANLDEIQHSEQN